MEPALWGLIKLSQLLPYTGNVTAAESALSSGGGEGVRVQEGREPQVQNRVRVRRQEAGAARGVSLGKSKDVSGTRPQLPPPLPPLMTRSQLLRTPPDPEGQRETLHRELPLQGDQSPGQP